MSRRRLGWFMAMAMLTLLAAASAPAFPMTEADAQRFGLCDGQIVRARSSGPMSVIFENVLVRVSESFVLDFHLDTDDASAAGLDTGAFMEVMP